MPKIRPLTEEQRIKAKNDAKRRMIGDGLAVFKAKNKLTNKQLGARLGFCNITIAKIVDGENVKVSLDQMWRLLDVAGIEIRKREVNPFD